MRPARTPFHTFPPVTPAANKVRCHFFRPRGDKPATQTGMPQRPRARLRHRSSPPPPRAGKGAPASGRHRGRRPRNSRSSPPHRSPSPPTARGQGNADLQVGTARRRRAAVSTPLQPQGARQRNAGQFSGPPAAKLTQFIRRTAPSQTGTAQRPVPWRHQGCWDPRREGSHPGAEGPSRRPPSAGCAGVDTGVPLRSRPSAQG